jgi:signal recognition particle subunit SRP68
MNVLEIITEERNMHGLRHHDYQRYRRYCTKKIHNLRKFLKLTQGKKEISKERNYC